MAKRQQKTAPVQSEQAPPPTTYPKTMSPLAESRMKRVAAHMATEVKPISHQDAYKSAGFWWVKLIFGIVAVVVDFVTNHNFISPNSVTIFTVSMAALLMVSEFFLLYAFYAWRENQKEGRMAEATKYLGLFIVFALATVVDFAATVVPVRALLLQSGSAEWLAIFMGILVATFTSVMQVDFYPTALAMAKSLLGIEPIKQ